MPKIAWSPGRAVPTKVLSNRNVGVHVHGPAGYQTLGRAETNAERLPGRRARRPGSGRGTVHRRNRLDEVERPGMLRFLAGPEGAAVLCISQPGPVRRRARCAERLTSYRQPREYAVEHIKKQSKRDHNRLTASAILAAERRWRGRPHASAEDDRTTVARPRGSKACNRVPAGLGNHENR